MYNDRVARGQFRAVPTIDCTRTVHKNVSNLMNLISLMFCLVKHETKKTCRHQREREGGGGGGGRERERWLEAGVEGGEEQIMSKRIFK